MQLPTMPRWLEVVLRVTQFIAAVVSLGLWADYLAHINGSTGAMRTVLGIVIAGTIWAVTAAIQYAWKQKKVGPYKATGAVLGLVIFVVLLDFIFICLFAAVAGITGPSARGNGAACAAGNEDFDVGEGPANPRYSRGCSENKAVFAFAIVNIFSFSGSSILNILQQLQQPPNPKTLAQGPGGMSQFRSQA